MECAKHTEKIKLKIIKFRLILDNFFLIDKKVSTKSGGVQYNWRILPQTDFVVSWYAKKYNKVIFRVGNLNKEGCRTWEQDGKKYMTFWDTVIERYTTCIDPMITYKRKLS